MQINLETTKSSEQAYLTLASLITPRPIALITSINKEGKPNAAPFSNFNLLGATPPICGFAPRNRDDGSLKDTARNINATHEFVVNLVDEALAEKMNLCATSLPYGEDELQHAGLTPTTATVVKPPRIVESPASFECVEWGTLQIGDNRVVIGLIKMIHIRDDIYDTKNQRVRIEKLFTIGRMASPDWYCKTRERFEMALPRLGVK